LGDRAQHAILTKDHIPTPPKAASSDKSIFVPRFVLARLVAATQVA
jgi:hypothetical protein